MIIPLPSERHILLLCAILCCASIYFSRLHIQLDLFWTGIALALGLLWQMTHLYCVMKLRCSITLLLMFHLTLSVIFISIPLIQGAIFSLQHTLHLLLQYCAFIGIGHLFIRLQWLKKQAKEA